MSANQPPENSPQQGGNPQNVPGATPEQGVPQQPVPGQPGANPAGEAPQYGAPGAPQYGAQPQGAPHVGPDGQPLPPGAYPPAGGFQPPAAAPAKNNNLKRIITSVAVIAISLIVVFVVRGFSEIKVDDCVKQVGTDRVEKVDCTSSEAKFKVLGIKEGVSQAGARLNACDAWPDATSIYWTGRTSASGTAYCLKGL
jgi:hypothetical protein